MSPNRRMQDYRCTDLEVVCRTVVDMFFAGAVVLVGARADDWDAVVRVLPLRRGTVDPADTVAVRPRVDLERQRLHLVVNDALIDWVWSCVVGMPARLEWGEPPQPLDSRFEWLVAALVEAVCEAQCGGPGEPARGLARALTGRWPGGLRLCRTDDAGTPVGFDEAHAWYVRA